MIYEYKQARHKPLKRNIPQSSYRESANNRNMCMVCKEVGWEIRTTSSLMGELFSSLITIGKKLFLNLVKYALLFKFYYLLPDGKGEKWEQPGSKMSLIILAAF